MLRLETTYERMKPERKGYAGYIGENQMVQKMMGRDDRMQSFPGNYMTMKLT